MIYLDNNATTKVHSEVFEAMEPFLKDEFGNPSTGYDLGKNSNKAVSQARHQVSRLINSKTEEIVKLERQIKELTNQNQASEKSKAEEISKLEKRIECSTLRPAKLKN